MENRPLISPVEAASLMGQRNRSQFHQRLLLLNETIPYVSFEAMRAEIIKSDPRDVRALYWYESGLDVRRASRDLGISPAGLNTEINHMALSIAIGVYSKPEYR